MRKFQRRRQRAGFVLLSALVLVVLGVVLFFRTDAPGAPVETAQTANVTPVQKVKSPQTAEAPRAVENGGGGEAALLAAEEEDNKTAAERSAAREKAEERAAEREQAEKERAQQAEKKEQVAKEPAKPPKPPVPATQDLWMSIPALGLYDNYVANSNSVAALDAGAAKTVESGFPWQENANTYISAHRLGWQGTASWHQFYNLPLLGYGDKVLLGDANGTTYVYEVTGFKEVAPSENWVTAPVPGKDMVSLQTCIENYGDYWTMGPNWSVRYVVRAERVDWYTA